MGRDYRSKSLKKATRLASRRESFSETAGLEGPWGMLYRPRADEKAIERDLHKSSQVTISVKRNDYYFSSTDNPVGMDFSEHGNTPEVDRPSPKTEKESSVIPMNSDSTDDNGPSNGNSSKRDRKPRFVNRSPMRIH